MRLYSLALISLFISSLYGVEPLQLKDVRTVTEELFSRHVEHKEFSPLIAGRCLKVFAERFDPGRIYLLEGEVTPYLEISEADAKLLSAAFKKGDLSKYQNFYDIIQKSIHRARKIRMAIKNDLVKSSALDSSALAVVTRYPSAVEEISARFRAEMENWLAAYAKEEGFTSLDWEQRLAALQFYESKRRQQEDLFLHSYSVKESKLALQLLKSIAASLDAHTMFYSQEEADEMRAVLHRQFCGIGIIIKEGVYGPVIKGCIPKSPAGRCSEIIAGDRLIEVDGMSVGEHSFKDLLKKLSGPEHSKIALTIKGVEGEHKKVTLTREKIIFEEERLHLDYEPFADGVIGKITLPAFYDNQAGLSVEKDLKEALKELKSLGSLYGLIIDLRGNSGGFLHQAIKTANIFVKGGLVVIAKYANEEIQYTRSFDPHLYFDAPLVVLTSKASASAAEVVAQSLKDLHAAIVVGDKHTYGKGSMQYQNITDPNARWFFKVTVGRYYTLSGQSVQMKGVEADIVVPTPFSIHSFGEKYLRYPLKNEHLVAATAKPDLKQILAQYLPAQQSLFEKELPRLRYNSAERLTQDRNFTAFREYLEQVRSGDKKGESSPQPAFGSDDLQLKEATNILKDMIFFSMR